MSSNLEIQHEIRAQNRPGRSAAGAVRTIVALAWRGITTLIRVLVVEPFQRRMRQEAAFRALMAMSDHQLRDIGLTRHDIYAAVVGAHTRTATEPGLEAPAREDTPAETAGEAWRPRPSEPSGQTLPVTARRNAGVRGRQSSPASGADADRPDLEITERDGLAV